MIKTKKPTLVVATRNEGKFKEISRTLQSLPLELKGLRDFPEVADWEETGRTFQENAELKARRVHRVAGGFVLADDSGLECEDLHGRPGVFSSRFAGSHATDAENNRALIKELEGIHDPTRIARYVCALCLIDDAGSETVIEETCQGMITFKPGGAGGFGYDPYFYLPEKKCTMAELPVEVKNQISHRGKAMKRVYDLLQERCRQATPNRS